MNYEEMTNEQLFEYYLNEHDEYAKEFFFSRNVKLAYKIANKFSSGKDQETREDIVSESHIGLVKAFNTLDLDKGYKFTTYAGMVIQNQILQYLRKYKRRKRKVVVSINEIKHRGASKPITIEDTLAADNFNNDTYVMVNESLSKFHANCTEKERIVYHLSVNKDMGQRGVAATLGVSQPYISRIMTSVKNKLTI